jgi:hypothetical protein
MTDDAWRRLSWPECRPSTDEVRLLRAGLDGETCDKTAFGTRKLT